METLAILADISSSYKVVSQLRGVWQVYSARRNVERFADAGQEAETKGATKNEQWQEETDDVRNVEENEKHTEERGTGKWFFRKPRYLLFVRSAT